MEKLRWGILSTAKIGVDKVIPAMQQDGEIEEIRLDTCNQYTIQGDLFSQAVLNNTEVPTPLEDAPANMKVNEAVIQSSEKGAWIEQ